MIIVPNTLVLFDVDGTLTEARQSIGKNMLLALRELARHAEISFVRNLRDYEFSSWISLIFGIQLRLIYRGRESILAGPYVENVIENM